MFPIVESVAPTLRNARYNITPSPYPYKWLWTYAGDKFFEAEGEIKFSPVYAHNLLLLVCCLQNSLGIMDIAGDDDHSMKNSGVVVDPGT